MYHSSYYLFANKYLLQKIIFVFSDIFLCLLWLFISPWMNASLRMAERGQNMLEDYHMFVYYCVQL
jgi:hypothetical protein